MRLITKDDIVYLFQGLRKKELKCPYCGSKPIIYDRKYLVVDICLCSTCGLFYVNPIYLLNQNIERYYKYSYSPKDKLIPHPEDMELMKKNNFRDSNLDHNDMLSVIRKLVSGNRLLEFGSSWGYFLYQANTYGFDSTGIEIGLQRAEYGRNRLGVTITNDINSLHEQFDVLCSFHTLEHIVNLTDILEKFHQKLLPGGSLFIEVPNFDPETKGKSVYSIIGKVHPLGFTRQFFENNLSGHGFVDINVAGLFQDLLRKPNDRVTLNDVIIVHAKKACPNPQSY